MPRALVIAALLLAATAPLAAANDASQINAAIARMAMPVVPDQTVIVGPCPTMAPIDETGCTWLTPDSPIYISKASDRWTLAHEMGHRYSAVILTQGDRDRFAAIMRYRGHPAVGDERLADAYATCAFGWNPPAGHRADQNFPTGNSYWPSQREQRRVCSTFRRAANRPL